MLIITIIIILQYQHDRRVVQHKIWDEHYSPSISHELACGFHNLIMAQLRIHFSFVA